MSINEIQNTQCQQQDYSHDYDNSEFIGEIHNINANTQQPPPKNVLLFLYQ